MTLFLVVLVAIEAFLIAIIVYQKLRPKYDGSMVITETTEKKVFSLEIERDPDTLALQKQIVLEVKNFSEVGARE